MRIRSPKLDTLWFLVKPTHFDKYLSEMAARASQGKREKSNATLDLSTG